MSQSIEAVTPGYGFLNLAFTGTFRAIDFDHDAPVTFTASGLPPGVTLGDEVASTVGNVGTSWTVDTLTELLTFLTDHHLQENDLVRVSNSGGALPTGINAVTDYFVIADGLTATTCKLSASLGGSAVNMTTAGSGTHLATWTPSNVNTVSLTGTPTLAGFFNITIVANGLVDGVPTPVLYTNTVIVEGGGYLAYYHLDFGETPPQPRAAIDLQYNMRTRAFTSIARDLTNGLELHLGEFVRIHVLISKNGTQTLGDLTPLLPDPAPTDVAFIVRPRQQFDGPAYLRAKAAGVEAIGIPTKTTRDVAYFDLTAGSGRLTRIFRKLNAPSTAEPSSEVLEAAGQLSFRLDGQRHLAPPLLVKFVQPYAR